MKSPQSLILASTSVHRRGLLERFAIPFDCIAPGVDESRAPGETALALASRLARSKANAVAAKRPAAWVIGSDQVARLDIGAGQELLLGKPCSADACIDQLLDCAGRCVDFITAVAVVCGREKVLTEFVDTTRVTFRTLERAAIERYVRMESPLDCAGGFKSEGFGITLCRAIDTTDPTALIGLPLIRLAAALRDAGFSLP